jgi:hypothetical protein
MLRHSCGYKLANDGQDTRAIQLLSGPQFDIGVQLMPMSVERFNAFVREELAANAALAKAAGITRQ